MSRLLSVLFGGGELPPDLPAAEAAAGTGRLRPAAAANAVGKRGCGGDEGNDRTRNNRTNARASVNDQALWLAGELTLAASSVPGEHLLPDLLAAFQELHPHVQVRASVTDSKNVLDQVEHGQVHLGLVGEKREGPHLEFRGFARDTLVLIVSAKHAWAGKERITLAQFGKEPLIVRETGSGSRSCLEQALGRAGKSLHDLRVTIELGSNEAIKEAVQRGMGIAVLSDRTIEKELQAGKLCALAITGLDLSREMFVTWDKRRVLPMPARLFLAVLTPLQDAANEGR